MADTKKPLHKMVDFDLPFVLFLEDGLGDENLRKWAEAYTKGEQPLPYSRYAPSHQQSSPWVIGGAFPVHLPPNELAPFYEVAAAGTVMGFRFLRRVNPHRPIVLMGEVPGDRAGRASFSSVRAIFDLETVASEHHNRMEVFCYAAVEGLNHFIDHYRVLANRPWIRRVTASMIQEFVVITHFEDDTNSVQHYSTGSGPLHGFGGAIPDEIDSLIRRAVRAPEPPDVISVLDVDIRDHLELHEWRLALIESAVLFEAWLARFLELRFSNKGLTESQIAEYFVRPDGTPRSITALAKVGVKAATGLDFANTAEYSAWEKNVRDLRNSVVHGERFDVVQAEAQAAYQKCFWRSSLLTQKASSM